MMRRLTVLSAAAQLMVGVRALVTSTDRMRCLGSSSLRVTEACLGTMTWGVQNSEADAHAQLDYAIKERGVNFIDTAELYPVPLSAPEWKAGTTERYIGTWLAANPDLRSKIVLATKVAGYSPKSAVAAARSYPSEPVDPKPDCRLDRASVRAACEASLRRLQTDYIDLYQIHWPDRYVPLFGASQYAYERERESVAIEETAAALKELLAEGASMHRHVCTRACLQGSARPHLESYLDLTSLDRTPLDLPLILHPLILHPLILHPLI